MCSKSKLIKTNIFGSSGYTLIEMAVVLIIAGVLIAAGSSSYHIYNKRKVIEITEQNMKDVTTAISDFRASVGRYPCPAPMTVYRDNPAYGHTTDCSSPDATTFTRNSIRTVTLSDGSVVDPVVRVGSVPFRELNLDESQTVDGYGNRITYAVTELLAVENTFNINRGGIEVRDDQGRSVLDIPGSGHFILISHGENRDGAFSRNGVLAGACPTAGLDINNCNHTQTAVFTSAPMNKAEGDTFFDDKVNYFARGEITPWSVVPGSPDSAYYLNMAADASIGIQTQPQPILAKGAVGGVARAREGILSDSLCDESGAICTYSSVIAGPAGDPNLPDFTGLECPNGQVMVGVSNNEANCRPAGEIAMGCDSGEMVTGIDDDGNYECSDAIPDPCRATTLNVCRQGNGQYTTGSVAAGNPGDDPVFVTDSAGGTAEYSCSNGAWVRGTGGTCGCEERTRIEDWGCMSGWENPNGDGSQWMHVTWDCDWKVIRDERFTYQLPDNNGQPRCSCVGGAVDVAYIPCDELPQFQNGGNYVGRGQRIEAIVTCDDATSTDHNPVGPPDCQCQSSTRESTRPCGGARQGNIVLSERFDCATNQWVVTNEDRSQCQQTCDTSVFEEFDRADCPAGQIGTRTYRRYATGADCSWGPDTIHQSNCSELPPSVCRWYPGGSMFRSDSRSGSRVSSQCNCDNGDGPCYAGGYPSYDNYSRCECR